MTVLERKVRFWRWFLLGSKDTRPGIFQIFVQKKRYDIPWLILLVGLSVILSVWTESSATKGIAGTITAPLIGIFIGVSFTSVTIVFSYLKDKTILELMKSVNEDVQNYIFSVQAVSVILLVFVGFCTLIAIGIVDETPALVQHFVRFFLFLALLISLWLTWQIINFSFAMVHLKTWAEELKDERDNADT